MTGRRFVYRAHAPDGATVSDTIVAASRADALRRLAADRRIPIDVREADSGSASGTVSAEESALVLRQLAVTTAAGVDLLEALDIIAGSFPARRVGGCLTAASASLRRGNRLATALRDASPLSYPDYVYALVAAGEASGRLADVLREAATRLETDRGVRRDIQNALVYPTFLVASGVASVSFLLYVVVPRFADMLTNARAHVSGFPGAILSVGVAFHDHAVAVVTGLAVLTVALLAFGATREGRSTLAATAYAIPGLGNVLRIRQRAVWARIMALALGAGVGVLEATALAAAALPDGALRRNAQASIAALRSGRPVDEAYLSARTLSAVDASLIRAGQRSGALAEMFRAVADRNDEDLRDALKRFTLVVEPLAIAVVAAVIGAIVLGLVSALVSIYDSIG